MDGNTSVLFLSCITQPSCQFLPLSWNSCPVERSWQTVWGHGTDEDPGSTAWRTRLWISLGRSQPAAVPVCSTEVSSNSLWHLWEPQPYKHMKFKELCQNNWVSTGAWQYASEHVSCGLRRDHFRRRATGDISPSLHPQIFAVISQQLPEWNLELPKQIQLHFMLIFFPK